MKEQLVVVRSHAHAKLLQITEALYRNLLNLLMT